MSRKTNYIKSAFIGGLLALTPRLYSSGNFKNPSFLKNKVNYETVADTVIGSRKTYNLSPEELKRIKEQKDNISHKRSEKQNQYNFYIYFQNNKPSQKNKFKQDTLKKDLHNNYKTQDEQDTTNSSIYKSENPGLYHKNEINGKPSFGIYSSFNSDIDLKNKNLIIGPFMGFPISRLKGLELRLYAGANIFPGNSKSIETKTSSGAPKHVGGKVYSQSNVVETKEKDFKEIGEAGISVVKYLGVGNKFAVNGGIFSTLDELNTKTNKSRIDNIFSYNPDGTQNILQSKKDGTTKERTSKKTFSYGPTVGVEFYPIRNLAGFLKGFYNISRKKMGFSAGLSIPIKSPQKRGKFSRRILK